LLYEVAVQALGDEALDSLGGRRWSVVVVAGPALGLIADVGAVFGPVAAPALAASAALFVLLALPVVFRTRYAKRCVFPSAAALVLALCFGAVVVTEKLTKAGDRGVLAEVIPFVADIQQKLQLLIAGQQQMAKDVAETKALVQQLLANAQAPTPPGAAQVVGAAVASIAEGATAGDDRLRRALDLLRANKPADAIPLLQAVAESKTARIKQDSKEVATATVTWAPLPAWPTPSVRSMPT
jgi:hypothetical protein